METGARPQVQDMTIQNPIDSPNTDCIDPHSVVNMLVRNVTFYCGDDHIAIKASNSTGGPGGETREELEAAVGRPFAAALAPAVKLPTVNFTVQNCTFHWGQGLTIGSRARRRAEIHAREKGGAGRGGHVKRGLNRGPAAAATRRVAAPPRVPRGYSAGSPRMPRGYSAGSRSIATRTRPSLRAGATASLARSPPRVLCGSSDAADGIAPRPNGAVEDCRRARAVERARWKVWARTDSAAVITMARLRPRMGIAPRPNGADQDCRRARAVERKSTLEGVGSNGRRRSPGGARRAAAAARDAEFPRETPSRGVTPNLALPIPARLRTVRGNIHVAAAAVPRPVHGSRVATAASRKSPKPQVHGDVYNTTFEDIVMVGSLSGPRLKAIRKEGGVIDGLVFRRMELRSVGILFSIDLDFHHEGVVSSTPPVYRNVLFQDITGWGDLAGSLDCLPESPCVGWRLERVFAEGTSEVVLP